MNEKPFGWVIIDTKTQDRYSTGSWSARSTKVYISRAKAEASLKSSLGRSFDRLKESFIVRPVYLNSTLVLNLENCSTQ